VRPVGLSILEKRLLHTIVNHGQPVLSGSGTLPKVIGLRLKLTRSLLSSPQLKRKLVCEVHGARAIVLGSFSGFLKKSQDAIPNVICCHSLIVKGKLNYGSQLLPSVATIHASALMPVLSKNFIQS